MSSHEHQKRRPKSRLHDHVLPPFAVSGVQSSNAGLFTRDVLVFDDLRALVLVRTRFG